MLPQAASGNQGRGERGGGGGGGRKPPLLFTLEGIVTMTQKKNGAWPIISTWRLVFID
jgi:hypothetical protein